MEHCTEDNEWLEKCLSCRHAYRRNDDDDIHCRCRKGCRYEERKVASDIWKLLNTKGGKEDDKV